MDVPRQSSAQLVPHPPAHPTRKQLQLSSGQHGQLPLATPTRACPTVFGTTVLTAPPATPTRTRPTDCQAKLANSPWLRLPGRAPPSSGHLRPTQQKLPGETPSPRTRVYIQHSGRSLVSGSPAWSYTLRQPSVQTLVDFNKKGRSPNKRPPGLLSFRSHPPYVTSGRPAKPICRVSP